jgi:hypothetical protein
MFVVQVRVLETLDNGDASMPGGSDGPVMTAKMIAMIAMTEASRAAVRPGRGRRLPRPVLQRRRAW